ncbi:hypothetical protein JC221_083 [Yersinia phage JC221]|nr:hypothetical protein JC221_083 [Yersinia phage JC221]
MIIEEVKGNAVTMYLEGKGHLIHGCNCFCNMGAGIAKEVKRRIPGAFQVDELTTKGDVNKLGTNSVYAHSVDNHLSFVYNAYTQYKFWGNGPNVDYEAIRTCFKSAVAHASAFKNNHPILTPLIGAGLAGGDWNKIRAIIEEATGDYPVIVVHFG